MKNSKIDHADYSIGYFISPHGFGHAARASAVMAAIHDISSSIRFEIFTTIPESQFYEGSWMSFIPEILLLPRIERNDPNGAVEAAQFVCKALSLRRCLGN